LDQVLGRGEANAQFVPLDATLCDVFHRCGLVDPLPALTPEQRSLLTRPSDLFPSDRPDLAHYPGVDASSKSQYTRHLAEQLRCHKVRLTYAVRGGGTVFCRRKQNGRLRVIWNGAAVSAAAAAPPKPPLLASPSSLLWLETSPRTPWRLVKRDGECMFDQLKLPEGLQPYMGLPPVTASSLCRELHCSLVELARIGRLPTAPRTDERVYPVLQVWGMGCSWSSLVCQSLSVNTCRSAGFADSDFLADEAPPPADPTQAVAVATDDICVLTNRGEEHARAMARRLDSALAGAGVEKNANKDIDGASNGTLIGIDLSQGRYLSPGIGKLAAWQRAGVELLTNTGEQCITPLALGAFLGTPHWFMQLCRPLYACFSKVYDHTQARPDGEPQPLSSSSRAELALAVILAPLAEVDTASEWSTDVLATDASKAYGFGVCAAATSQDTARRLGRLAKHHSFFATLQDLPPDATIKPRTGEETKLPLRQGDFRTVISSKARYAAHSGTLEANAVALGLRWLSRRADRYGQRLALLCDAQAVLHALKKGRSSAPTITLMARRIAAVTIAMGWVVHYVYIPSEWNPADEPSRRPLHPIRGGRACRL